MDDSNKIDLNAIYDVVPLSREELDELQAAFETKYGFGGELDGSRFFRLRPKNHDHPSLTEAREVVATMDRNDSSDSANRCVFYWDFMTGCTHCFKGPVGTVGNATQCIAN